MSQFVNIVSTEYGGDGEKFHDNYRQCQTVRQTEPITNHLSVTPTRGSEEI